MVSMFFYIASHNPCHKQAIEEDLDFTTASGSRNLQWLTETNRLGKPGLGLVEKYTEKGSRRIVCRLSPKGKQFVDNFISVLYE